MGIFFAGSILLLLAAEPFKEHVIICVPLVSLAWLSVLIAYYHAFADKIGDIAEHRIEEMKRKGKL